MTNNPQSKYPLPPRRGQPPVIQDILFKKQASQFPDIGMTLSSYNRSSNTNRSVSQRVKNPYLPKSKPSRFKRIVGAFSLKRSVIVLVLIVLLTGGWLGGKFLYNAHKVFGGNIFNALSSTKLKGEDVGRVNILLAGNSADDAGHNGADLTDSIMIMSLDTKNHKAFLLSIPRDLWVNVPGYGHTKINAAYVYGKNNDFKQNGFPAGGMGQLEQVIEQDFGISINYYGLVNYAATKQAVDAVGGIDITVASSDKRGLYDPSKDWTTNGPLVKLTNGVHHLNGEQALDLARARGDAYGSYGFAASDFERTQNQRQILVALKTKIASAGVLSNPAKLSSLADAIGNNAKTDLNLSEMRRLYDLSKAINANDIQSLSLNDAGGKNLLASYTSSDGESALIPAAGLDNFDDIQAFIAQHMSSNPVVQEGATVVVLNATDTTGLATKSKTSLAANNINVVAVGDAITTQAKSSIIDLSNGKMPATRAALGKLYANNFITVNPYAGVYKADFIILLGIDQVPAKTPTATQ